MEFEDLSEAQFGFVEHYLVEANDGHFDNIEVEELKSIPNGVRVKFSDGFIANLNEDASIVTDTTNYLSDKQSFDAPVEISEEPAGVVGIKEDVGIKSEPTDDVALKLTATDLAISLINSAGGAASIDEAFSVAKALYAWVAGGPTESVTPGSASQAHESDPLAAWDAVLGSESGQAGAGRETAG